MNEQFVQVNDDIELCYETFGDPSDPTVLLVMGLGTQMVAWHEDFCGALVDRGFHVVRFDNRDIGRSTHLVDVPAPTIKQLVTRDKRAAAYRLDDMAADAIGLLDHLGIEKAHLVGASMGGMIAQTIAAKHPDRVESLVSIMSNTGNRWKGQPAFAVMPVLLTTPPKAREEYVEFIERLHGRIGSTSIERDIEGIRQMAGVAYDRRQDPRGAGRQLAAVIASGDRTEQLRAIRCPTLVIHGTADKLVRPSGGKATAKAIPGAELLLIDGMGHDLPRPAWDQIIDGIVRTARRAGASVGDAETQAA